MAGNRSSRSYAVLERLHQAQNQHRLEAFVECFAPDYQSEQPIHPDRTFRGPEQVRKNWSTVFSQMPDFHAELLRATAEDDTVWAEWRWTGTQSDGGQFDWRGVTIFGVQEDQITWARLYLEPVQEAGAGIDGAVRNMTHGSSEGH